MEGVNIGTRNNIETPLGEGVNPIDIINLSSNSISFFVLFHLNYTQL